jgi:hypothetical protein
MQTVQTSMPVPTGTGAAPVPKLKLSAQDAAKVEQARAARKASAKKAEMALREQEVALDASLQETSQKTGGAAAEPVCLD